MAGEGRPGLAGPAARSGRPPAGRAREAAAKNLEQWLDFVADDGPPAGEPDLRLSLEIALAQGFKHAANRRDRHPHAHPEARVYLVEKARDMLRGTSFWFTRLTLVHALCLWSLPDGRGRSRVVERDADHKALVERWARRPGRAARAPVRRRGPQARRRGRWRPGSPSGSSGSTRAGSWPGSGPGRPARCRGASTTCGSRPRRGGPRSTRVHSSSSPTCSCC